MQAQLTVHRVGHAAEEAVVPVVAAVAVTHLRGKIGEAEFEQKRSSSSFRTSFDQKQRKKLLSRTDVEIRLRNKKAPADPFQLWTRGASDFGRKVLVDFSAGHLSCIPEGPGSLERSLYDHTFNH